ncbi:MAG: glycosyltransferase family 2 protein, partial [Rubellimicrobium sp.]|nr:glycosyltransferase family 2 protein [Rubellimicrobium sp.]
MTRPTVSVIVPLYKTEAYVENCLRSIMSQTLREIEILCIDDCSPDGSAAIVERLAEEDDRIVLIRHEVNLGLGGARNTGIRAARADYIASVDSDDYVEPDFLERLWEGAAGGHYDVVVCGFVRVAPDGEVLSESGTTKMKVIDPIPADHDPFRISEPAFWNKLWRRSLYVDNDIWFPNHIYHQDSATTPRIYCKARNVRFIGGDCYKYLVRDDSVTQSTSDKHLLDRYRSVDVLKDFFIREGLSDRLKDAIDDRVYSGYSFHVQSAVQKDDNKATAMDTYLRHLLIMREAYLEYDTIVRGMSFEEKAEHLVRHKPLPLLNHITGKRDVPHPRRPLMPRKPSVLVLTLYSGENEFEAACASLEAQTHRNWKHRVFRGGGPMGAPGPHY